MSKPIKIIFIIPSLRAGGAERVMSFLAENINQEKFESRLLVVGSEKDKSYSIKDIPVVFFEKDRVRDGIFSIFKYLLSFKPDIVISAMAHVNNAMALLSVFFPKTKFVGRETIVRTGVLNYSKTQYRPGILPKLMQRIQKLKLDAIICQSNDMKKDLLQNFDYPKEKLFVLNNPVTHTFGLGNRAITGVIKQYITVGRLVKQKGYLRILKALAKLDIPFHYTIIGSGDEKDIIFDYIESKNLGDNVTHVPFTDNVQRYLAKSDLYLQGSYVEGFPNALLESCAVGTPVLAFDALGGINEIVQEGINGYVAKDESDFLEKLKIASHKTWDATAVNHSVISRYSEKIILQKYEDFFLSLHER